jgi:hypothetical protein
MKTKKLFMGTTKIDPQKTVGEIMQALVASGARQIASTYDDKGQVVGLRFSINASGIDLAFVLPVRVEPLLKCLRNDRDQARRVAWRQLLRWVQAQLAMIEVGMVRAEEVYVPYMLGPDSQQTLFEALSASRFKAIESPKKTMILP